MQSKIAAFLILLLCACASHMQDMKPENQPAVRVTNCDGLNDVEYAGCVDSLLQRLDEIETAKGKYKVVSRVRNGDYVSVTYEYCWSDFCRNVTPPPYFDPPWYKVWGERIGMFVLGFLTHFLGTL